MQLLSTFPTSCETVRVNHLLQGPMPVFIYFTFFRAAASDKDDMQL